MRPMKDKSFFDTNILIYVYSVTEPEKQKVAIKNFRGIDKDTFLSKVAKAYMAILGDGRGGIYCEKGTHFCKFYLI